MTPAEIRSIRVGHGLTIVEFAEWLTCDPAAVEDWETGTAVPSKRETARLQFVRAIELRQASSPMRPLAATSDALREGGGGGR